MRNRSKHADDVLNDEALSHDDATPMVIAARATLDVLQVRLQSMDAKIATQKQVMLFTGRAAQSAADPIR